MSRPATLRLYSGLTRMLGGIAYRRVCTKLRLHGTDPHRFPERLGHATEPRPEGRLIWFHAASVGESLSVLKLIAHMGRLDEKLQFLMTSGTASSAEVLANRLPARTIHQFAPLDTRAAVTRFLDHWAPHAGVFVESELWPHMLEIPQTRGIPLALINARISARSARWWRRFSGTARHVMTHFSLIHCQDEATARTLRQLGLTQAETGGNLKAAADPLPVDMAALAEWRATLADRPLWVASSTHPGEEAVIAQVHQRLLSVLPDLLLILVPRHPERAGEVSTLFSGLTMAQRSTDAPVTAATQVYLADTMGETGLWYALSPIVFLGGSLTPVGGHNPYEPAQSGAAILHGPLYANFSGTYADFHAADAAIEVADGDALYTAMRQQLEDSAASKAMGVRAQELAQSHSSILDDMSKRLFAALLTR